MNSNIMQCDDGKLKLLLAASDHDAEHDPWMHHVAQCSQCQSRLRELAADDDQWQKAAEVLVTNLDGVPCFRGEPETTSSWNASMVKQLLDPPSHPEMLGRLGRYEMERMIGSGGMGIVFKACDTELNRVVAVKVLAPYLAARGSARKRFAREARAAAGVRDDHVVPIFNVESEHEPPFLVMQYVAGGSLQEKLNRDGPLEVAEVLRIGLQTAKGLVAAHTQGLIHRDVKPSNILLDEGVERALLTDFGLARAEDDACLTRSGFHPGTPHYMSPEQVRGEAIDGRSDLFGLGCVLYALCTGHSPFRADTSYAVMRRITDEAPRPIRELNANIPEWLEAIVMKLLSKSCDERFESATEVAELLEGCLAHVQEPTTTSLPLAVAKLAKSFGLRTDAEPANSLTGFCFPPIGKFLAAAAFAFFSIFGAIIFLETGKGTLRIETNSDTDVPIIVRQGDEIVEHLTVSHAGAKLRLHAGTYEIELQDDKVRFNIIGDQVQLERGGQWIARVTESKTDSSHGVAAYSNQPTSPEQLLRQFLKTVDARTGYVRDWDMFFDLFDDRFVQLGLLDRLSNLPDEAWSRKDDATSRFHKLWQNHLVDASPVAIAQLRQDVNRAMKSGIDSLEKLGIDRIPLKWDEHELRNVRSPRALLAAIITADPPAEGIYHLDVEYRLYSLSEAYAIGIAKNKRSFLVMRSETKSWKMIWIQTVDSEEALQTAINPYTRQVALDDDRSTRITLEPKESSHARYAPDPSVKPPVPVLPPQTSPEFAPVKITIVDDNGKPMPGTKVRMFMLGQKDQPVEVDGVSDSRGAAIDQVLPYGKYSLQVVTEQGWELTTNHQVVQFGKGLELTLNAPATGMLCETKIETEIKDWSDSISKLPFGVVHEMVGNSNGYFNLWTPEPGEALGEFKSFPTPGHGIAAISYAISLRLSREVKQFDDSKLRWLWSPPDHTQPLNYLLSSNGVHHYGLLKLHPFIPTNRSGFFTNSDDNDVRFAYYELDRSQAFESSLKFQHPAGQMTVYLRGIHGEPNPNVQAALELDNPDESTPLLPLHLQDNSKWLPILVDPQVWSPPRKDESYLGHLLRQDFERIPGDQMTIQLKAIFGNDDAATEGTLHETIRN